MGDFAAGFFSGAGDKFGDSLQERVRINQQAQQFKDTLFMDQKRFGEEEKNNAVGRGLTQAQIDALVSKTEEDKGTAALRLQDLLERLRGTRNDNAFNEATFGDRVKASKLGAEGIGLGNQKTAAEIINIQDEAGARAFNQKLQRDTYTLNQMNSIIQNSVALRNSNLQAKAQEFAEKSANWQQSFQDKGFDAETKREANRLQKERENLFSSQTWSLVQPILDAEGAGSLTREEAADQISRAMEQSSRVISLSKGVGGGTVDAGAAPTSRPVSLVRGGIFNKQSAVEATGKPNAQIIDVARDPIAQERYWNANPGQLIIMLPGTGKTVVLEVHAAKYADAMETLKEATKNMPPTATQAQIQEAVSQHQSQYNADKAARSGSNRLYGAYGK